MEAWKSRLIACNVPRSLLDQIEEENKDLNDFLTTVISWVTVESDSDERIFRNNSWKRGIQDLSPSIGLDHIGKNDWKPVLLQYLSAELARLTTNEKKYMGAVSTDDLSNKLSRKDCFNNEDFHVHHISEAPLHFIKTEEFERLVRNTESNFALLHLHGNRGSGKHCFLLSLLQHLSISAKKSSHNRSLVWQFASKSPLALQMASCLDECGKLSKTFKSKFPALKDDAKNGKFTTLFDLLIENRIKAIFAFDQFTESVIGFIQQLNRYRHNNECFIQAIFISEHCSCNLRFESDMNPHFLCFQIQAFSLTEACAYLMSPEEDNPINRYPFENSAVELKPFNQKDATELAKYLGRNPVCMKATKYYCIEFNFPYAAYLKTMQEPAAVQAIHENEAKLLARTSAKNFASFKALHSLDTASEYLAILCYLHNEDIPVFFISRICQRLRLNNDELSVTEREALNQVETLKISKQLSHLAGDIEGCAAYMHGCITLPQYLLDSYRASAKVCKQDLRFALEIMIGMISKDNRERHADIKLNQLRPHIDALVKHSRKYLSLNFDLKRQDDVDFMILMSVCRLHNLLGQALIQNRISEKWQDALDVLFTAATYTWTVACSYTCVTGCGLFQMAVPDSLEYVEGKDPKKDAKKIAKQCADAGVKMKEKFVDKFILSTLVLDRRNVSEFEEHTAKMYGKAKSCILLKDIRSAVENHCMLTSEHLEVLRSTGNFLPIKCYQQSFLAEQICSIFHTYGRMVVYWHEHIDQQHRAKCEYYTAFSHCIAKEVGSIMTKLMKSKTKLGIMPEYITLANAQVPRLLHNRENETDPERNNRLYLARQKCQDILRIDSQLYENGIYKQVEGTDYTILNAMKLMVKANTKLLLKLSPNELPEQVLHECNDMLQLALKNINFDMSPHCVIQAAKFLAAYGNFKDALDTFLLGFEFRKNGKTYGILQCTEGKPDTYAWAIHNYAMAIKTCYEKTGQFDMEHKDKAIAHCRSIVANPAVKSSWKPEHRSHIEKLQQITS